MLLQLGYPYSNSVKMESFAGCLQHSVHADYFYSKTLFSACRESPIGLRLSIPNETNNFAEIRKSNSDAFLHGGFANQCHSAIVCLDTFFYN